MEKIEFNKIITLNELTLSQSSIDKVNMFANYEYNKLKTGLPIESVPTLLYSNAKSICGSSLYSSYTDLEKNYLKFRWYILMMKN